MGILGADWEKFAKMMAKRSAKNRALARSPKTPEDSIADSGTSDWTGMTEQGYGLFHKLTGPGKRARPLAPSDQQSENTSTHCTIRHSTHLMMTAQDLLCVRVI